MALYPGKSGCGSVELGCLQWGIMPSTPMRKAVAGVAVFSVAPQVPLLKPLPTH